jgi:hydrogenase/urease accessory protein HupE
MILFALRLLAIFAATLALVLPAGADVFRPAYLQLREVDANTYDVLWKTPALDESTMLGLRPSFPAGSESVTPAQSSFAAGSAAQRWRMRVNGGLAGRSITFPGMRGMTTDVLVRIERSDGTVQLGRVLPANPSFAVTASPGMLEVARTYTVLGVEHILSGADHLLFVLALLILVTKVRRLVATVTAFTIAHSLTLAAATLGWLAVPGPPVEAAIALSIVFVAAEIIHGRQGRAGLSERAPWIIAFAFGLLHGLGFASALAEVGLPPLSIPAALLFFNLGVEAGQLLFIGAVLAALFLWRAACRHWRWQLPQWSWRVPPYAIGGLASFWLFERLSAF